MIINTGRRNTEVNKDTSFILDYHEKTKHSEMSVMNSPHYLDWDNHPNPFKTYIELPTIPLPIDFSMPSMDAIMAISKLYSQYKQFNAHDETIITDISKTKDFVKTKSIIKPLTLKDLASILFFSAGITREIKYHNNTFYMRAASATGALYPIEIYIVCKNIYPDLQAGIYHFNPAQFSLINIRKGDYRNVLASIAADNQYILNSSLTIIFTSLAWRNAWKYQDRSYRHWYWDAGVIAANLIATTSSMDINTRLIMGFMDDQLNSLLALEKEKEVSIAMAAIDFESIHNLNHEIQNAEIEKDSNISSPKIIPISKREIQFPLIWKTHESSKLFSRNETKEWTNSRRSPKHRFHSSEEPKQYRDQILKIHDLPDEYQISNIPSIGETILRRGSTRKFTRSSIPLLTLSSIIYNSTRGISIDFKEDKETLIDIYLIVNDIKGLDVGGYFYNRNHNSLELIKDDTPKDISGHLCLDQALFSDASVVMFLMANLNKIIKTLGNRGYRASQFEAGIMAGKIYLSAYAHGIGASGSTFYDDLVTNFFLPHSKEKSTMIAVGIGNPSYKSRSGKILPVRFNKEQLMR
jgi:SagB-type dehydrogenase family enzyme